LPFEGSAIRGNSGISYYHSGPLSLLTFHLFAARISHIIYEQEFDSDFSGHKIVAAEHG
jgi:hypothetical protein